MRASVLQRACRKAQQEVINAGIILEPYSLISIRSAAIHRFLMSDGAKGTSTAQYAGISEAYALQMQSVGLRHSSSAAKKICFKFSCGSNSFLLIQSENMLRTFLKKFNSLNSVFFSPSRCFLPPFQYNCNPDIFSSSQ